MFLYFSLAMVANAFFIVMCGYAVITMMFYKVGRIKYRYPKFIFSVNGHLRF